MQAHGHGSFGAVGAAGAWRRGRRTAGPCTNPRGHTVEFLPIGKREHAQSAVRLAVARGRDVHRDHITGFDAGLAPAHIDVQARRADLNRPLDLFAALAIHHQLDVGVRIGPLDFLDDALDCDLPGVVEFRRGMMGSEDSGETHRQNPWQHCRRLYV